MLPWMLPSVGWGGLLFMTAEGQSAGSCNKPAAASQPSDVVALVAAAYNHSDHIRALPSAFSEAEAGIGGVWGVLRGFSRGVLTRGNVDDSVKDVPYLLGNSGGVVGVDSPPRPLGCGAGAGGDQACRGKCQRGGAGGRDRC